MKLHVIVNFLVATFEKYKAVVEIKIIFNILSNPEYHTGNKYNSYW